MLRRMCRLLGFDADAFVNADRKTILSQGDTVPTDATAGYAVGCIFQHRDGGEGTAIYINEGTEDSCDFNTIASLTAAQELGLNQILGTAAVITNATHVIEVASSDVATTGTVRSAEIVHTVGVADATTIREALYVSVASEYMTGDWTNAIVGRIDYGTAGNANGGMAAAVCGEMNMMATAQGGGTYYCFDAELNCPTGHTNADNAALPVAFLKYGLWGNATAMGSFEDGGYLWHSDGFTAGAGNILSANSQTMRVNIEGDDRYEVLSQIENGLGLGVIGTPMALTNATHAVSIFTNDVAETGTVRAAEITHTVGVTDLSTIREALYVNIDSAYTTGDWTNAIVGRINYTAPGKADGGMAAAICGEMSMPGAAQTGGAYYCIDAELECPASFTCAANAALPVAFMKFGVWGDATAVDSFEAGGYLFHIDGIADTANGLFDATDVDDPDFTHALKINIGGTDYFIGLSTNVAFNA